MPKTILLTGATDGIGLLTAEKFLSNGHNVLIHGRTAKKLDAVYEKLKNIKFGKVEKYLADLSNLSEVEALADDIIQQHSHIDILINNAGIYKTDYPVNKENMDVRFMVNTIAPYLLTKRLLPKMDQLGRVVNLSSAAQSPVDLDAILNASLINNQMSAYSQSKLAITMWSRHMSQSSNENFPSIIAVNPGSLLASKMVKEGFGVEGKDLNIGADIIIKAALSEEFSQANGLYFDNDIGQFGNPHPDALDSDKCERLVLQLENSLKRCGIK